MAKKEKYPIKVENVTKKFKVYYDKPNTLKERLVFWQNNKAEEIVQENNSETDLKKENKTEQKEENKKQEDLKKEKKAYKKNDETKSVDEKKEVKSENVKEKE